MIPAPLNPVINNATQAIPAADAVAFWDAIIAIVPLPPSKSVDKITGFHVVPDRAGTGLAVNMTFKN
jgi:hypothetical protein